MAGPDIEAMPERERPECLYEVQHYESAVRDGLERMGFDLEAENEDVQSEGRPEGARRVAVHMAALLQMMMLRAATALSVAPMTLMETQGGEKTRHERAKANPSLDAFRRLSGEHRRYFALVCDPGPMIPPPRAFKAARPSLSNVAAAPRVFEPPPAHDAPPPSPPPDTSCEPHRVPDAPDRAIGAATNTASEAPTDGGPGTISDMPVLEISATVEATPEPESALPDCAVLEADATDHSGADGTGEELEAGEVEVPITDPVETETGPEAGDIAPLVDAPAPAAIPSLSPEAMDEWLRRAAAEDAAAPRPWAEEDVHSELVGGAARFSEVSPGPPPKIGSVKKPSAVLGLFSLREPGSLPPPHVDAVDWPKDAAEQYRWRRLREKITAARVHLAFAEEQAEEDKRRLGGVCGVVLAELKRSQEAVARLEEEARATGVPLPRGR